MGYLTTHVLDTSTGRPGHGIRIELFRLEGSGGIQRQKICETITNDDGRCDAPILDDENFIPGTYELIFHVGSYFDASDIDLPDPKFIDQVPIRFGISGGDEHYHVPLLLSPYSYSTYRGS